MKKKFLLSFFALVLASCAKTNNLYKADDYNHSDFNLNYYTDWNGLDKVTIAEEITGIYSGFTNTPVANGDRTSKPSLSEIDDSFMNTGVLSKLYDGRITCEGLQTRSRVQLNKTGFATYFPKILQEATSVSFVCRGGTNLKDPLFYGGSIPGMSFDFKLSFYIHIENESSYNKITYTFNNTRIQCDNGGGTNIISFNINPVILNGCVGMSLSFESNDSRLTEKNLTDDYLDNEKNHLSLMLYEVFIGDSIWR